MTGEKSLVDVVARPLQATTVRTLVLYALCVLLGFAALSEALARAALARSADVIQSLLGMYADPGGEPTTVAPDMLSSALLGMSDPSRFVILRTVNASDGMPRVYYLSPGMPAKLIEETGRAATPSDLRAHIVSAVGTRWTDLLYHRQTAGFDLYLTASRRPALLALGALAALTLLLLPVVAVWARRTVRHTTRLTLAPLQALAGETRAIRPTELTRRVTSPTGVAELTGVSEAINDLVSRVEAAHLSLTQFTADVSHELRTPLTHLRAQVQWALDERRHPDEVREALGSMGIAVDQTCKLIEGLLTIARGDSRELTPRLRDFDVGSIADEVAEIGSTLCADKAVSVSAEAAPGTTAHGDPEYTRQILLNFVTNAARHTSAGNIVVAVQRDRGSVIAEVRDSGEGIAPEHLPRIFDRFYRVDVSRSRDRGGAGLGLAIARTLAGTQRARVSATSIEGRGSIFRLDLPDSRTTWETRPPASPSLTP